LTINAILTIYSIRAVHKRMKRDAIDTFGFQPRRKLTLSEIVRRLKAHKIIEPCPSKSTLMKLCENGTLETVGGKPTSLGWLVYEDSLNRWLKSLDEVSTD
jgi:hypothetical protein